MRKHILPMQLHNLVHVHNSWRKKYKKFIRWIFRLMKIVTCSGHSVLQPCWIIQFLKGFVHYRVLMESFCVRGYIFFNLDNLIKVLLNYNLFITRRFFPLSTPRMEKGRTRGQGVGHSVSHT